jgi:hypothetical protein
MVRGFWGPREESPQELALRWKATLDRLAELLGAAHAKPGESWMRIAGDGPAVAFPTDGPSVLAALRAEQAGDDWSDRTGVGPFLVRVGDEGWKLELSGRTGGVSEHLLQALFLVVESPEGAEVPEPELLTALAEFWEPDYGDVSDDATRKVLRERAGAKAAEPGVGSLGYLSPARAALVPDDLKAVRTPLRTGGVLLDIAPPGDHEAVLAAYLRLRAAGALQPLPRPMDRSRL